MQMCDFPSFRRRLGLRWSSALHGSFVLIQIPFPSERAMANIAGERFWSAPARVSLQGESARENASACRTCMHRDRCCGGCCCLPLGGATIQYPWVAA